MAHTGRWTSEPCHSHSCLSLFLKGPRYESSRGASLQMLGRCVLLLHHTREMNSGDGSALYCWWDIFLLCKSGNIIECAVVEMTAPNIMHYPGCLHMASHVWVSNMQFCKHCASLLASPFPSVCVCLDVCTCIAEIATVVIKCSVVHSKYCSVYACGNFV